MVAAAARRYAANVDANQTEIVEALRQAGATVQHLHAVGGGVPDILVGYNGENWLLEIKNPKAKGRLNDRQVEWFENWNGHACVVRSVEEALSEIMATDAK